jgi:tetratricopeptide (TPR) repeat protein
MRKNEDPELRSLAERALRGGKWQEALGHYGKLLAKVEVFDVRRYDGWLEGALAAFEALGRTREAGFVLLALRRFSEAQRHFPAAERPLEWALAASRLGHHAEAARVLSEAGHPVLAALELEDAGAYAAARLEWERVVRDARLAGQPYELALARLRLGRALLRAGDAAAGARELATAQRLIEAVADEAETRGEVEHAIQCYVLLIHLGREAGSFENVAEGYLNGIRLFVRHDRYDFAFQYYDDFLAFAVERKEWYAAATLAREAATYAVKKGLVYERHYLGRAAELWEQTATHNEAAGGPVELSENALHAAIDVAVSMNDHALVARLYGALAALPVAPKRRARYAALAKRGAAGLTVPEARAPGFPRQLRKARAYKDSSRNDLVEWALAGDATAVLARILVGADRGHDGDDSFEERKVWRSALLALLVASAPKFALADARAASALARALGAVDAYAVHRPLAELSTHASPEVRAAVMTSIKKLYFEPSVRIVQRGLADPAPAVVDAALRTLRVLGWRQGFEAFARLYREAKDDHVRLAALDALTSGVQTFEAGLFILDVVRQESGALARAAAERLAEFQNDDLLPVVRQAVEVETGERRAALERVAAKLAGAS